MESPFWKFSLDRYRRKGVAPLCLELQEEAGADVNIVLFLLWLGQEGYEVAGRPAVARIEAQVADWHSEIVKPLRAVRRAMKTWPVPDRKARDVLRADLQKVEIGTEQMEQAMLHAMCVEVPSDLFRQSEKPVDERMRANLAAYLAHLQAGHLAEKAERLAKLCLNP